MGNRRSAPGAGAATTVDEAARRGKKQRGIFRALKAKAPRWMRSTPANKGKTFADIPKELLPLIFFHLGISDRLSVRAVNRKFHWAVGDSQLNCIEVGIAPYHGGLLELEVSNIPAHVEPSSSLCPFSMEFLFAGSRETIRAETIEDLVKLRESLFKGARMDTVMIGHIGKTANELDAVESLLHNIDFDNLFFRVVIDYYSSPRVEEFILSHKARKHIHIELMKTMPNIHCMITAFEHPATFSFLGIYDRFIGSDYYMDWIRAGTSLCSLPLLISNDRDLIYIISTIGAADHAQFVICDIMAPVVDFALEILGLARNSKGLLERIEGMEIQEEVRFVNVEDDEGNQTGEWRIYYRNCVISELKTTRCLTPLTKPTLAIRVENMLSARATKRFICCPTERTFHTDSRLIRQAVIGLPDTFPVL